MERDGREVTSAEDSPVNLAEEHLTLGGGFGKAHVISYRNIAGIEAGDYRVHMDLNTGESVVFSHLGRGYEGFTRDLNARRNGLIVRDYLMYERAVEAGLRADYVLEEGGSGSQGSGEVILYETALVLATDGEGVTRIPYGLISDIRSGDYTLTVEEESGTRVTLSGMGRAHHHFVSTLSETLDSLAARTARELDEMMPTLGPEVIGRLTPHLRDGRAAARSDLEALSPGIWDAFTRRMEELGCLGYYEFLRSLSGTDAAYLGTKRGLLGDDVTGHYVWFMIPFVGRAPRPGNALAMEVAGEEGGRATYFFRLASRGEYPEIPEDELSGVVDDAAREINRCMMSINFRREPIYLPGERLREPRYAHYAAAVAALPSLGHLREMFIGRVIHRSEDGWRRDVSDLLNFNIGTRDDSARWRREAEIEGEPQ